MKEAVIAKNMQCKLITVAINCQEDRVQNTYESRKSTVTCLRFSQAMMQP